MQGRSMLSIVLIVTMLICGTHFAEEAHHGFCDCTEKNKVALHQKCEHIVLNACRDGRLSMQECELEEMLRRIRHGAGVIPEEIYSPSEIQHLSAYSFIGKRISVTDTYSHKILLDYIHLQDGESLDFI